MNFKNEILKIKKIIFIYSSTSLAFVKKMLEVTKENYIVYFRRKVMQFY